MRTIAVADAFMAEKYYRDCFEAFPDFTLDSVPFFGLPDRGDMRETCRKLEREGPGAAEPPENLTARIENAEALMTHLCPVSGALLERALNLIIILSNRGGLENIDLAAATARNIPVLHNPAHNANSVTELTIGLMIAEMRNIARTHACLKNGQWRERYRNAGNVYEISGKTVGIIGFGNIGRRVARKLTAFDCKVLVYDPFVATDDADLALYGCEMTSLDRLLAASDIVTLHARASGIILGRAEIALMKEGAYFINTARPHMLDNAAMADALKDGRLMGAAFDVYTAEPPGRDDLYVGLDNVTLTNHRGGDTENCYSDSPAALLKAAQVYFAGGEPRFFANRAGIRR
jgi:D-3-phosphoglycerate dehydrogenase / 2-oxoglutarate reductase